MFQKKNKKQKHDRFPIPSVIPNTPNNDVILTRKRKFFMFKPKGQTSLLISNF